MAIDEQINQQNEDLKYAIWLNENKTFLERFILENVVIGISLQNERWNCSNELTVEANLSINENYCETISDSVSLDKE